jgi:hypothetical protein
MQSIVSGASGHRGQPIVSQPEHHIARMQLRSELRGRLYKAIDEAFEDTR